MLPVPTSILIRTEGTQSEGLAYLLQYIKAEQGSDGEDGAAAAVEDGEAEAGDEMEEEGDAGGEEAAEE